MDLGKPIDRRRFFYTLGMSAGLLTHSKLRPLPGSPVFAESAPQALQVLSAGDGSILAAAADRMVVTGDPRMPPFRETSGLQIIDHSLRFVPEDVSTQLHWALQLFQYAPPVFVGRLSTFTGLDAAAQDDYIASWAESRFAQRRILFQALKNLSYLGYYSDDATWKGIHYDGPWVPRPRRL